MKLLELYPGRPVGFGGENIVNEKAVREMMYSSGEKTKEEQIIFRKQMPLP